MGTVSYRSLLPEAGETDARTYVETLDLSHSDPAIKRPWTLANFVASVDGRAAVDGLSRKLSDLGDRELFRSLRERADAVLVGTATLAAENYGRMLPEAERRQRRTASGRSSEPLVVTATRSGHLPLEIPLFAEPDARVVVFAPTPPNTDHVAATVIHEPLVDLAAALSMLQRQYGVAALLCEGGPTLFGALVRERLVNELFLTLTPVIVGGASGSGVISGPAPPPSGTAPPLPQASVELDLAGVLERDGTLFLRYRFPDAQSPNPSATRRPNA